MAFCPPPLYNPALPKSTPHEGKSVKNVNSLIVVAALLAPLSAVADDVDAGLAAVRQLGVLNGQALACADKDAAAHARVLMLAHAPKTARFGAAYEEATQEGYLAQTRAGGACPEAKILAGRIDAIAQGLRTTLPAAAPAAK